MNAPRDTSWEAWSRVRAAYRRLAPEERLRIALELSEEVTAFAVAGIRDRHPEWTDSQVLEALHARIRTASSPTSPRAG
jgi:hypothetical protein